MRKLIFILLLILTACTQIQNLPMDGNPEAAEYLKSTYNTDIKTLKVDFIRLEEYKQLRTQTNNFIVLASSPQCEYCLDLVPNFVEVLQSLKVNHLYFIKFDQLEKKEQREIARTFTSSVIPTVLFFKNGSNTEFQGEFDLQRLTTLVEEFLSE